MAESKIGPQLDAVYGAKQPSELADHYDQWANSYENDMSLVGYRHPTVCLALLARHLPSGAGPLLDAGAGTGLMGEWLGILGYPNVEALDFSEGMLAVAARKNVYAALHRLALGRPLYFTDSYFAGIVASGVFSTGHVGTEGLDELIRICRPDGIIALTVKTTLLEDGFEARLDELAATRLISRIETTPPYVSMPGEVGVIPSRGLALRVKPSSL